MSTGRKNSSNFREVAKNLQSKPLKEQRERIMKQFGKYPAISAVLNAPVSVQKKKVKRTVTNL